MKDRATVRNLLTGEVFQVKATTENAASSYSRAVWETEDGEALGEVGSPILGYELLKPNRIRNINPQFGESIAFETVEKMAEAIRDCGYSLPNDGLLEGRDYETLEPRYMHKETGATDTREGWEASYDPEELEARGLTAAEAFDEDEGETLLETEGDA